MARLMWYRQPYGRLWHLVDKDSPRHQCWAAGVGLVKRWTAECGASLVNAPSEWFRWQSILAKPQNCCKLCLAVLETPHG